MKKIESGIRSFCIAGLFASLLFAQAASADSITIPAGQTLTTSDDSGDVSPQLNGWFSNIDSPPAVPVAPDPSQAWTSAANIATMNYWLSVVAELGDDPSLINELYGLGMIDSAQVTQFETGTASSTPEPVTWALLAGGLVLLALFRVGGRGFEIARFDNRNC